MEKQNQMASFDKLAADIAIFTKPIHALTIKDDDSLSESVLRGKEVKHYSKMVEEKRKELVGPLNEQVKQINDYAKRISAPLAAAEDHIKKQMRSYEIDVMAKRRKEEEDRLAKEKAEREAEIARKAAEDQERIDFMKDFGADENDLAREEIIAQATTEREVAQLAKETKSAAKAISSTKVANTRRVWKFEVENPTLVPREYLVVNETMIRAAVTSGIREIPGVRIYEDVVAVLK